MKIEKDKIPIIVGNVIGVIVLILTSIGALFLIAFQDDPNAQVNNNIFMLPFLLPISILISLLLSWSFYSNKKYKKALVTAFYPTLIGVIMIVMIVISFLLSIYATNQLLRDYRENGAGSIQTLQDSIGLKTFNYEQ